MKSVLTVRPTYSRPYKVFIGIDLTNELIEELGSITNCDKVIICVQKALENHKLVSELLNKLERSYRVEFASLPDGETVKDLEIVLKLLKRFYELSIDRSVPIIAIGGGALGDAIGFAASIFMRGLPLILIPTTLLSMIDSAIGGKNAVNMYGIKNLLGTFYQPSLVIEDLRFLETLPQREYRSGIAEALKYGLTLDKELYVLIKEKYRDILNKETNILLKLITKCVSCKGRIVELDEREERMIRQVLNLGHTIGHAVEAYYSGKYLHGEAVMIGLIAELKISEELGYTRRGISDEVKEIATKYNLPYKIEVDVDINVICDKILHDKKRVGDKIIIPIVKDLGSFEVVMISIDEYLSYVRKILTLNKY